MTEVFFYILADEAADASARFACRLTEKAHAAGHRVYLHVADARQAEDLDDLLWQFRQGSFVPHATLAALEADDDLTPVVIGTGEPPAGFDDVLVNLGGDVGTFFSRFARHNEIVAPADVAAARSLYRFYKDRGYALTTHRIAAR
ncbi:DNA polymerase III subunit chi [Salinisphaera orenii]|uniref:DNA polymerase III subunit chi n=1 Tax=Salinisphaera orenii YIM 95161 TaxID=1051139 RepID=A0A423QAD5_9GAMM|nr:DNA polymerase III subunit chi [Salinisphaera halophila]ROO37492.1 DNA polymerase III subunit chi [Salinisphaera halophila YIM 95161]